MSSTPRVIVESPYTAKTASGLIIRRNYLKACLQDCVDRGESPFAGHGFYTQFLNDRDPKARELGMRLARQWMYVADYIAVYLNFGWSAGMIDGAKIGRMFGKPIIHRALEQGSWQEDQ
jgi:hypothetical protein